MGWGGSRTNPLCMLKVNYSLLLHCPIRLNLWVPHIKWWRFLMQIKFCLFWMMFLHEVISSVSSLLFLPEYWNYRTVLPHSAAVGCWFWALDVLWALPLSRTPCKRHNGEVISPSLESLPMWFHNYPCCSTYHVVLEFLFLFFSPPHF